MNRLTLSAALLILLSCGATDTTSLSVNKSAVSNQSCNIIPAEQSSGRASSLPEDMTCHEQVYHQVDGQTLKLDVYFAKDRSPRKTLLFIHGGGWIGGDKSPHRSWLKRYLDRGYAAVNINYRLAEAAPAPAAVADSFCALKWIYDHAEHFGFDTRQIVVSGDSAGGHLALMVGMAPQEEFTQDCPTAMPLKVSAVVNWYGITDVEDILPEGPNEKFYATAWFAKVKDHRLALAQRVSPLSYSRRSDLPPIFSAHGTADKLVPYQQAARLHKALDAAGQQNHLHTVLNGQHGEYQYPQFSDMDAIYSKVFTFLENTEPTDASQEY